MLYSLRGYRLNRQLCYCGPTLERKPNTTGDNPMRTFIITFASGRTAEHDAMSAGQIRRHLARFTSEAFTINVKA